MCGRARCTLNPAQIARACGFTAAPAASSNASSTSLPTHNLERYRPAYNVAPGAYLPVVVRCMERKDDNKEDEKLGEEKAAEKGEAAPAICCMKWGLVPSFMKKTEKPDHYKMFNARSESIKEKASFRRLIPKNRCLVVVEGFYEWKKDGYKKQPYYIHFKDHRPLVFAALYDSWKNSEGETLHTFTILTTRSSTALQWLHDRMPVILGNKNSIDIWLSDNVGKAETGIGPYEDADLVWYPVTTEVGKPSFDGPECIKEIQLKSTSVKPISKFFTKKADEKDQTEQGQEKLSQEAPSRVAFNSVKEESDTSEDDEHNKDNNTESLESEDHGIKREFEEIGNDHDLGTRYPIKKKKPVRSAGDRQASLLSYFGKK